MERTCINCKETFQVEKKRGRQHTKCESCRKVKLSTGHVKTVESPTKITTQSAPLADKPKRIFRDTPTKGNPRYSRLAFLEKLETVPDVSSLTPQEIAGIIRSCM